MAEGPVAAQRDTGRETGAHYHQLQCWDQRLPERSAVAAGPVAAQPDCRDETAAHFSYTAVISACGKGSATLRAMVEGTSGGKPLEGQRVARAPGRGGEQGGAVASVEGADASDAAGAVVQQHGGAQRLRRRATARGLRRRGQAPARAVRLRAGPRHGPRAARREQLQAAARPVGQGPRKRIPPVISQFPELAQLRALFLHVRRRMWEDARDTRERSRSPEAERKRQKGEKQQHPEAVRFYVKNAGDLSEDMLRMHFALFGNVSEMNVLMDKKKKKSRGMAYVTIAPTGYYQGKRNTRKTLLDWMLGPDAGHTVAGYELEVTLADAKPVEDPERAHEERVEERRRLRLEQEKRRAEAGGMAAATAPAGPEKLLLSPWAKRWRKEIKERLPKESAGPTPWIDPRVKRLATELWDEVVEYVQRGGCQEALCALETFRKDESEEEPPAKRAKGAASEGPWAHVPAADLLLAVGEGIVAFTTEGLVAVLQEAEPTPPPAGRAEFVVAPPAAAGARHTAVLAGRMRCSQAGVALAWSACPHRLVVAGIVAHRRAAVLSGGAAGRPANAGAAAALPSASRPTATLEVLRRYFGSYGNIVDAVVMFDKETGKPRGFGFVCFDNVASVNAVMRDYSKHCIDGKWIEVKRATPAPQQAPVAAPPGAAAAQGALGCQGRHDWSNYDCGGGAQWAGGQGYGAAGRSDCWKCVACGCGKTTVWASLCKHCGSPRQGTGSSGRGPDAPLDAKELQMLVALARRAGDQATAARYQGQLDAMAAASKPPPKALQDQVSDLHHRIKKLDGRLEAELAKLARWQDGIKAQEVLIHDLSKQSEAMVTEHRQLVAQLHTAVVPPSDADAEVSPGPTFSLRDLVDGRVSNIVIDDGGLFSVGAEGMEASDLQEVERRRADFKEHIGKAAKALFAEAMERAAVAKAEHDGYPKRMEVLEKVGRILGVPLAVATHRPATLASQPPLSAEFASVQHELQSGFSSSSQLLRAAAQPGFGTEHGGPFLPPPPPGQQSFRLRPDNLFPGIEVVFGRVSSVILDFKVLVDPLDGSGDDPSFLEAQEVLIAQVEEVSTQVTGFVSECSAFYAAKARRDWADWLTENVDQGGRRAHGYTRDPQGWTPSTTLSAGGCVVSDPHALLAAEASLEEIIDKVLFAQVSPDKVGLVASSKEIARHVQKRLGGLGGVCTESFVNLGIGDMQAVPGESADATAGRRRALREPLGAQAGWRVKEEF
ncbi:unnamed protein product [Prorocentrum cordatum]|uniref:RRM domain-containing protein n=1 Tax=Prorocentrum cordatum TaxID=2364126 RepID=A0ABN9XKU2_9DINO|nr:unnamed protein product [Polarella glacialis]